ncbi:hypothetical protein HMPREF9997_00996 [Corynebacterium durum F0235]|uniref:Uncharacterized protein n=1 Tax=Corynebacterium durum F0235 TaxID=1035195 RepID=L1MJ36_9CORY|nr:hypothetical protein HMPREF9997_00996 [Corynebacterium durum F0235]
MPYIVTRGTGTALIRHRIGVWWHGVEEGLRTWQWTYMISTLR